MDDKRVRRAYKEYQKHLRESAAKWFERDSKCDVNPNAPYILKNRDDWSKNIITLGVANYIESKKKKAEEDKKFYPLHKYIHHGLSSQAMAFNLLGSMLIKNDFSPLIDALAEKGVNQLKTTSFQNMQFEYSDNSVFNEMQGQPTSFDFYMDGDEGKTKLFFEVKLSEVGFGGCSVFTEGDCPGINPLNTFYDHHCYLVTNKKRRYWERLDALGFTQKLSQGPICLLANYYQFFREVAFALTEGGYFILLHDARNPAIFTQNDSDHIGIWSFLMNFVPEEYKDHLVDISIERVARIAETYSVHRCWGKEFLLKYGFTKECASV